tara:strand:- start:444 stop:773 length:330 start_codon:yes stop_codon:yes gene_type:complete
VAVAIQVKTEDSEPSIRLLPDHKWETKDTLFATVSETAKYLGTSRQYVHKLITQGKIRTLNQDIESSKAKTPLTLLERMHMYAVFKGKLFLYIEDILAIKKRQVDRAQT